MSRFIRWRYVLPRLGALAIVWLVLQFSLPPLLKSTLVQSGEAAVGAKVEIGQVETSLAKMQVVFRDVAVANPSKPFSNLVAADEVVLDVETSSLLRKRFVIQSGLINGLRFDSPRETSGVISSTEDDAETIALGAWAKEAATAAATAGAEGLGSWLDSVAGNIEDDLRREFRSPDLAEQLAARWPAEYDSLEKQVRSLRDRGKQLERRFREVRDNPLRHAVEIAGMLQEADALRRDTTALATAVEQLRPRLEADLAAVEVAKAHDLARIRQHVELGHLDPQAISEYLLSREVAGRVSVAVEWLRFARLLARREKAEPARGRGWDVLFVGSKKSPNYLVRSLAINGEGRIGGQPYSLVGTVIGLTTQPKRYGRPTLVKLAASGAVRVHVEASFDRTGDTPIDHLVLDCPVIATPGQRLGDGRFLALDMGPATVRVEAELTITGRRLEGVLQMVQQDTTLTPQLSARLGGAAVAESLAAALADLHEVTAAVRLTGTLNKPAWKLESNLGDALASGVKNAWRHELTRRRDAMVAKLQGELDGKLAKMTKQLDTRRAELLASLNAEQMGLAKLVAGAANQGGSPIDSISRGLNRLIPR